MGFETLSTSSEGITESVPVCFQDVCLQRECDKFTDAFALGADEETLIEMQEVAESLKGTKLADKANNVAQLAPDFELPDQDSNTVQLSDLLEKGPVIVSFFCGSWCPHCSIEVSHLLCHHAKIQAKGASLIAIAPMVPEKTKEMAKRCCKEGRTLPFPILSDFKNQGAKKCGLADQMLHGMHKGWGFNVPAHNGDDSWELSMPVTCVVLPTSEQRISFRMVDTDYT